MEGVTDRGVVVHVSEADPERHLAILRNVANLRADLGPGIPIELVAHGPGVELLTGESGLTQKLTELESTQVSLCACANTIKARGLAPNALLPEVKVVASGVGHLARRQLAGWAYLRP